MKLKYIEDPFVPFELMMNPFDSGLESEIVNIELGNWFDIPTHKKNLPRILQLPLLPRKKLIVDLEYDDEIRFEKEFIDEDEVVTFPIHNPIFNGLNQRTSTPAYRFEADYSAIGDLPSLEEAIRLRPQNLRVRSGRIKDWKKISRDLAKPSLEETLMSLYRFVHSAISGKEHESNTDNDMNYLVNEFLRTGKISGDCKSVSTFTTGLAHALGLYARRLGGELISPLNYQDAKLQHENRINRAYENLRKQLKYLTRQEINLDILRNMDLNKLDSEHMLKLFPEVRGDPFIRAFMLLQFEIPKIRKLEDYSKDFTQEKAFISQGRQWSEVYIPLRDKKGVWFLMDPSQGFEELKIGANQSLIDSSRPLGYKEYPSGNTHYVAEAYIPVFLNPAIKFARLRVDYK